MHGRLDAVAVDANLVRRLAQQKNGVFGKGDLDLGLLLYECVKITIFPWFRLDIWPSWAVN